MKKKRIQPIPSLPFLLKKNQLFLSRYKKSSLMKLISSARMSEKAARSRLLDCIQVFSNYFQKAVMLRHVLCDDKKFHGITHIHLTEEFNHNIDLLRDRKYKPPVWDAILDATACWFSWKMFIGGEEEKTVLIHLVLEASANVFFHAAHQVMQHYGETNYFKVHSELDEEHEKIGIQLLTNLSPEKYLRLLEVQKQGWDMLNTVCEQITQLTLHASV